MKKLYGFLCDRRMLAGFFVVYMLVLMIPMQLYGNVYHPVYRIYYCVYCIWTLFIILHDILAGPLYWNRKQILLVVMWVGCLVSLVEKGRPYNLVPVLHLVELAMLVYVFYSIPFHYSSKQTRNFLNCIAWISVGAIAALTLVSLFIYVRYPDGAGLPDHLVHTFRWYQRDNGLRYAGIFYHPTVAGCSAVTGFVLVLHLLENRRMPIWAGIPLCLLFGFMIYISRARTPLVQAALVLLAGIIYLMIRLIQKKQYVQAGAIAVGIVAAAVFVFLRFDFLDKLKSYAQFSQDADQFSAGRLSVWAAAWDGFQRRMLFGWGFENGEVIQGLVQPNVYSAHNIIMSMLLWTGLLGTVPLVIFLVLVLIRAFGRINVFMKRRYYWMVVLMLCCLLKGMLDPCLIGDDMQIVTAWFWLAISII